MAKEPKPWEDKSTFLSVMEKDDIDGWKDMARHFTRLGHTTTEATMRRWAEKHDLRVWYLEDKLKRAQQEAKDLRTERNRLEREIEKVSNQPRTATPDELVSAERRIEAASARARKYQTIAKSLTRETNLLEEIREELRSQASDIVIPDIKVPPKSKRKVKHGDLSTLLSLNDLHWGDVVDPKTINNLNAYDPYIACNRLEEVVDTTITFHDTYSFNHNVNEMVVLLNGDLINNGHGLHPEEATDYARVGKQVLDCAMVLAQVIREIAQVFPNVRVVATSFDNHSRSTRRNSTSAAGYHTSWGAMTVEFIASFLSHIKNVFFEVTPSYTSIFDIKGHTFAAAHGQQIKGGSLSGVPANGLHKYATANVIKSINLAQQADWSEIETAEQALALLSSVVKYTLVGHWHQDASLEGNGHSMRIAPSLKGADAFSVDVLNRWNPAAQALFTVNERVGITGAHQIEVQDIMEASDSRYVWGALEGTVAAKLLDGVV